MKIALKKKWCDVKIKKQKFRIQKFKVYWKKWLTKKKNKEKYKKKRSYTVRASTFSRTEVKAYRTVLHRYAEKVRYAKRLPKVRFGTVQYTKKSTRVVYMHFEFLAT